MNIKQLNEELQKFLETQDTISFGFINEDTGILYGEPKLFDKFEDIMDVVTLGIEPNKVMLLSVNDEGFGTYSRISGTTLKEIEANWVKQWKEDPEIIYDCFDEDTGLIMETDEEFDTDEEFIKHAERYYTESYIDGDSGSAIVIFNPFTEQVLIGGDIEVQPIENVLDELEADFEDEEDYTESFKTKKSHKRKLKECSDRDTIVELARKYGDNITLKDILAKIRNVDERLSDQERKSTSKFMKRVEKIDSKKKEK